MDETTVLVTSVGGNVGQGVVKALRAARRRFRIVGVDMEPRSAGFSFVDVPAVVPRSGEPGFVERMARICEDHDVQAVYVCSDVEVGYFSSEQDLLESELCCPIFVNPPEVVEVGTDKLRTARFLAEFELPYAETVLASDQAGVDRLLDEHGLPVIVKPRDGASSKNVFLIESHMQLAAVRTLVPDLVVQQYLPGDEAEYTAGTVSSAKGHVQAVIVLRRDLLQGTTYRTELIRDAALEEQIVRIVNTLHAVGPCNVQFRVVDGVAVPFEINPRFSGTTGVRYLYGFNDAELVYDVLVECMTAVQPDFTPGVMLRYWDEVFIPGATFDGMRADTRSAVGGQAIQPVQANAATPASA